VAEGQTVAAVERDYDGIGGRLRRRIGNDLLQELVGLQPGFQVCLDADAERRGIAIIYKGLDRRAIEGERTDLRCSAGRQLGADARSAAVPHQMVCKAGCRLIDTEQGLTKCVETLCGIPREI